MKSWTPEELEYLRNKWGEISIPSIAKNLKRTVYAIKNKACKLGLGRHLHNGEEVTFFQLVTALGKKSNYNHYAKAWPKHGCPVKYKKSIRKKYLVIIIDKFWKWAEEHKNLLDFSSFETNALGEEPTWVPAKRRADIAAQKFKTTPWTPTEDKYLISLLDAYQYGYKEISEKMCRTEGALKRRMVDLGLKQRPLKADNHIPWNAGEVYKVKVLHSIGYMPELIAEQVNRSACAVRGLIERIAAKGELQPRTWPSGKHYKKALPQESWHKAERFIRIMAKARSQAIAMNIQPEIDLSRLRESFSFIEKEMAQ